MVEKQMVHFGARRGVLARPLIMLLIMTGLSGFPLSVGAATLAQNVTTKINRVRVTRSILALRSDKVLTAAAQAHADDMIRRKYFSHSTPLGTPFYVWLGRNRAAYTKLGENIAYNVKSSSDRVLRGWMSSPGHRANMLRSAYTSVGVGVARGTYRGKKVTMVVAIFGQKDSTALRRRSATI